MRRRLTLSAPISAGMFLLGSTLPREARARPDLVVETPNNQLGGTHALREVIVKSGGEITVPAYDASDSDGTGQLHLRATRIIVERDATISALGMGHAGQAQDDGAGPGGGKAGVDGEAPGGGGAFRGAGGSGTMAAGCSLLGGTGGKSYGSDALRLMGSAGGADGIMAGSRGGNGGGILYLEANSIRILGTLKVGGAAGTSATGGGAGGTIHLRAHVLEIGASAIISVEGGAGGAEKALSKGGGGGGGLIIVEGPAPASLQPFLVEGGASGCSLGTGGKGVLVQREDPGCLDLDEDGFDACDPTQDCDDADAAIHAGVEDVCDGVDNDCNGVLEELCETGFECTTLGESKGCTPVAAGSPAAKPLGTVFSGGCAVAATGSWSPAGSSAMRFALACAVAACAARSRVAPERRRCVGSRSPRS